MSPPQPRRPAIPEGVTWYDLDGQVRRDLRSLPKELAERVGGHLAAAGRLLEEDPEAAYAHAREARRLAARVGVVREAAGVAAHRAGAWAEAIAELRAHRRMTGDATHLPLIADCERALGRPERVIELHRSPEAGQLGPAERAELAIVAAGARQDLGQPEAALQVLQQTPGLTARDPEPWVARVRYALAEALLDAGRAEQAREWFERAAAADPEGQTDAVDRLLELDGVHLAGEPAPEATAPGEDTTAGSSHEA